jgi:antitoxin ParD1/3/4
MNVSLTPELAKFVEKEVESGLYQTASEVVRAGLRRLKDDRAVRLPQTPKTLEELEAQLLQSIDRLDRGEGVDGEQVFRRLARRKSLPLGSRDEPLKTAAKKSGVILL